MSVKEIIKKNKVLYTGVKIVRTIQYGLLQPTIFEIGVAYRKYFEKNNPLENLKDKYKNKRCFIIATGPSLTIEDLSMLKDEYTFGMNSLCKIFPELGWETTFFGIQDFNVYKALQSEIEQLKTTILFCGSNLKQRYSLPDNAVCYPLDLLNHTLHPADCYKTSYSSDCKLRVYDGYSITYSLIQIATYLGFSEIYLLGCDCGYSGNRHHFIEHGIVDPSFDTAQKRMFFSYEYAKKYAESHNISIYNSTRGGYLEIFPRISLDKVVGVK